MKKIFLFSLLFTSVISNAQKKTNRHTPILQKGWYLSFNPHSLLEPEEGAVGLGVGYRLSDQIEIWTELNYLYKGFLNGPDFFNNMHGFRSSTSFKYYYSNKFGFFVGIELRIKKYSFDDKNTFINSQTHDTLINFSYRPDHTLIGGAVFWGKRFKLTANGKLELEGNIGIGVKQRNIDRKNVPAGYLVREYFYIDRISPIPDSDVEQTLPYFPAIFRFVYHF
jgi:Protein of unknown function (DUF3575)